MARLIRKALTTEHTSRSPLAEGDIGVGAESATDSQGTTRLQHVTFVLRGSHHRYLLELKPTDCDRAIDWLARQATLTPWDSKLTTAEVLRNLADLWEAGQP